jgi:hypothetical protein
LAAAIRTAKSVRPPYLKQQLSACFFRSKLITKFLNSQRKDLRKCQMGIYVPIIPNMRSFFKRQVVHRPIYSFTIVPELDAYIRLRIRVLKQSGRVTYLCRIKDPDSNKPIFSVKSYIPIPDKGSGF